MIDSERTRQFLSSQNYMVIAVTLPDGTPWAVPVRIQKWEGGKFEWDSKLDTVHSQALATQPRMAITIFEKDGDKQLGFYAKGKGGVVVQRDDGFGRYQFTVEKSWINDETFTKREVDIT